MVRKVDGPQACELGLSPLCAEREHTIKSTYSLRNKLRLGCSHLSSLPAAVRSVCLQTLLWETVVSEQQQPSLCLFSLCCIEQVKGHLSPSPLSDTCFSCCRWDCLLPNLYSRWIHSQFLCWVGCCGNFFTQALSVFRCSAGTWSIHS